VLHADLEGQPGVDALLEELAEVAPAIDIVVDNAGASIPEAGYSPARPSGSPPKSPATSRSCTGSSRI